MEHKFMSPYIIKEWFKILEYKMNYSKTFGLLPYFCSISSFLMNFSFYIKLLEINLYISIYIQKMSYH